MRAWDCLAGGVEIAVLGTGAACTGLGHSRAQTQRRDRRLGSREGASTALGHGIGDFLARAADAGGASRLSEIRDREMVADHHDGRDQGRVNQGSEKDCSFVACDRTPERTAALGHLHPSRDERRRFIIREP
jgi:hypothetical protein